MENGASDDYLRDLVERLYESDEASALTNKAARIFETILEGKEIINTLMIEWEK